MATPAAVTTMAMPSIAASQRATPPSAAALGGLYPPFRFSYVEENLTRGAYPKPRNFRFLRRLGLQTILSLTPKPPNDALQAFCAEHGIRSIHLPVVKAKETIPFTYSKCAQIVSVLIDAAHLPMYVHCLDGLVVTGVVMMCLRKLQHWSPTTAFSEYMRAGPDAPDVGAPEFAEKFPGEIVIPPCIPAWLWGGQMPTKRHPTLKLRFAASTVSATTNTGGGGGSGGNGSGGSSSHSAHAASAATAHATGPTHGGLTRTASFRDEPVSAAYGYIDGANSDSSRPSSQHGAHGAGAPTHGGGLCGEMGHGPPDGDGGGGGGGGRGTHPAPRGRMTAPGSPHPGMALATTQPLMMLPGALSSPLSSPLPLGAMPLAMPAPASAVVPHGPRETISPFGTYDFESASYVRSNPRLAYGGDGSGGAGSASGDHGARSPGVPRDGRLIHLHAPLPRHHAGTHHPGHGSMDDVLCGADGAPGGAHGGTEGLFDVRDAARRGRCITESPRCCPPSGQPDYLAYPDVGRHETSGLHVGHVERGAVAGMAERGLEREMSASGAPTARTSRHDVEEDEEENEEDDEMDEDEEARVLMETSKTLQALALETSYGRGRFASRR